MDLFGYETVMDVVAAVIPVPVGVVTVALMVTEDAVACS